MLRYIFITVVLLMLSFSGYSIVGVNEENPERDPLPCLNKQFTIVVHIVKDSLGNPGITEADIELMVNGMQSYWNPICVTFEICEFRYIDNFQYDDLISSVEWPQLQIDYRIDNRINMFFVNSTDDGASFATLGGIAQLESGGIVMVKSHGIATMVHEMGHYFGLSHTFEGSGTAQAELVDGSNCQTAGDGVCDTPADPYSGPPGNEALYLDPNTCEYTYMGQDANGDFYTPLVSNMMSYYSSCRCSFTYGQYQKMVATYYSNPGMW